MSQASPDIINLERFLCKAVLTVSPFTEELALLDDLLPQ
jgi:hypothetical protein